MGADCSDASNGSQTKVGIAKPLPSYLHFNQSLQILTN